MKLNKFNPNYIWELVHSDELSDNNEVKRIIKDFGVACLENSSSKDEFCDLCTGINIGIINASRSSYILNKELVRLIAISNSCNNSDFDKYVWNVNNLLRLSGSAFNNYSELLVLLCKKYGHDFVFDAITKDSLFTIEVKRKNVKKKKLI